MAASFAGQGNMKVGALLFRNLKISRPQQPVIKPSLQPFRLPALYSCTRGTPVKPNSSVLGSLLKHLTSSSTDGLSYPWKKLDESKISMHIHTKLFFVFSSNTRNSLN